MTEPEKVKYDFAAVASDRDPNNETDADRLTQARLDLMASDAIREALVKEQVDTARQHAASMHRALEMVKEAFIAGHRAARKVGSLKVSAEDAYLRWCEEIKTS